MGECRPGCRHLLFPCRLAGMHTWVWGDYRAHRLPHHTARACRDPLIRTGQFEELWRARVDQGYTVQQGLAIPPRSLPTPRRAKGRLPRRKINPILRHFSYYAPQRYESWADPRRKYACTLNAIALTLADIAGDARQSSATRARAEQCLDAMTARDILEAGLAADFGEICMRSVPMAPLWGEGLPPESHLGVWLAS